MAATLLCNLLLLVVTIAISSCSYPQPVYVDCSNGTSDNSCWTGGEATPCNNLHLAVRGALKHNSTVIILKPAQPCISCDSFDDEVATENATCPAWFYAANDSCKCGNGVGGRVFCNETLREVRLHACNCMTYDDQVGLVVGACLYNCYSNVSVRGFGGGRFYNVPKGVIGKEICDPHNREGRLCGKCKEGYAPPVYSYDLRCVKCNSTNYSYFNWAKYIAVAFLPLTLFFYVIVALGISATSASMNAFILISQALATPEFVRITVLLLEIYSPKYPLLFRLSFTMYGIWNLDFFRTLIPPFCLPVNTLQALAMDYAIAFYPMVLIVFTYALVELHARNVRIIIWVWKPFHRCLARFRRQWNMKTSLVEAFATFLLLSYIKLLNVSFTLLVPTQLYDINGDKMSTSYLFYDATVEMFGKDHLPYAILAISVLLVVVLLPLVVVLLYPLRTTQRCLNRCRLNSLALRTFTDAFQGSFKDGTNGTRDCRYFAVVYQLPRMLGFVIYSLTPNGYFHFPFGLVLTVLAILIATIQPYKKSIYNKIDTVLFLILAMLLASLSARSRVITSSFLLFINDSISLTLALLPLVYCAGLVLRWLYTHTPWLRNRGFCRRKKVLVEREEELPDRIVNPEEYN